jgi:hypothetical protein
LSEEGESIPLRTFTTSDDDSAEVETKAREERDKWHRGNEKFVRRLDAAEGGMKFSHSIQFNAVPDWSSYYIAYSNLKKLYVHPYPSFSPCHF